MGDNVIAIVPAAGLGTRLGPGINKQFHALLGKPIIAWTLDALERVGEIREIVPVLKDSDLELGAQTFERYRFTKIKKIAPGGKERQDSVYNALKLIRGQADTVLIHDGVRPFPDPRVVREAIRGLDGFDGVITAVPLKDTIKEGAEGIVVQTLRRDCLWAVQTPQVFPYDTLLHAYESAMQERFYSTDDSALVERIRGRIRIVEGSYANIKVTTREDLALAEYFLSREPA